MCQCSLARMALYGLVLAPLLCSAEESDTALQEIVVTAQRRSQSEQDIGVSVTAVDGAALQALRIQQPLMLSTLSPSLSTRGPLDFNSKSHGRICLIL